jgi:hypothetical protein
MAEPGSIQFVIGVLERFAEKHVKIIALDAVANLVEDTPRKTGWARANWIPAIGTPANVNVDVKDPQPGQVQGRSGEREAGVLLVASSYKLSRGPIFITNNVPYIRRLNDGHSQQAPAGFVQAAILRAVRGAFKGGDQTL